jgi:hypothetical protein
MAHRSRALIASLVALLASASLPLGCARRIGDGCTLDTDCSINNDRRCDISQVGGYCTVAECDRSSCPDDALCVEFFSDVARRARRFCMAPCVTDGDCRSGYTCQAPDAQGLFTACPPASMLDPDLGCTRLVDEVTGAGTPRPRTRFCARPLSAR